MFVKFPSLRTVYQARNSTMPPNQCFRCDANLAVVSCGPVYHRRAGNLNATPLGNTTRVHPRPMNLLVTGIITRRCRDSETSKLVRAFLPFSSLCLDFCNVFWESVVYLTMRNPPR
ncbi:hypothetical protein PISMIDRAFT_616435 [Pisolithus microcarpus 441]|uniref:Uncharacterized protein n=1 Tax=Pisolithus microcarpus 441 TaxID=765257 RepID=A0A0C9ZC28_9AGAM|nr:hypothetical protein PISMIDRAFT_616435 [Pisolithus microcarpus 441]